MSVDESAYVAAFHEVWDATTYLPRGTKLRSAEIRTGSFEVHLSDPAGIRISFRTPMPTEASERRHDEIHTHDDGIDDRYSHWALWQVLIPIMEELDTGAGRRIAPEADGERWIIHPGE